MAMGIRALFAALWSGFGAREQRAGNTSTEPSAASTPVRRRVVAALVAPAAAAAPAVLSRLIEPAAAAAIAPMPPLPKLAAHAADTLAAPTVNVEPAAVVLVGPPRARKARDFRLPARLAATRAATLPTSRRNIEQPSSLLASRVRSPDAKVAAPRRHVWLAARPGAPAATGQIIMLPTGTDRPSRRALAA